MGGRACTASGMRSKLAGWPCSPRSFAPNACRRWVWQSSSTPLAGYVWRPRTLLTRHPPIIANTAMPPDQLLHLCLASMCWAQWVTIVHLVQLGRERGLSPTQASSLLTFLSAGSVGCRFPLAAVADRYGRRCVWAALLLIYALVCAVCSLRSTVTSSRAFLAMFAFATGDRPSTHGRQLASRKPFEPLTITRCTPTPSSGMASSVMLSEWSWVSGCPFACMAE